MLAKASDRDIVTASLRTTAQEFPVCGSGKRLNCVVDGDTFWFNGEKIRIESIDAPEVRGQCRQEKKLAERATQRLAEILSRQAFTVQRSGLDRYGRTLASIEGSSGEAGAILVREGLARPWSGRKEVWCNSDAAAYRRCDAGLRAQPFFPSLGPPGMDVDVTETGSLAGNVSSRPSSSSSSLSSSRLFFSRSNERTAGEFSAPELASADRT